MAYFPTFSEGIAANRGYAEQYSKAGDLVSQTDAGYEITRRKFTRRPKIFTVPYKGLNAADKDLMDAHIETMGTTGNFYWVNPVSGEVHDVRMAEIPELAPNNSGLYWGFTVTLKEL